MLLRHAYHVAHDYNSMPLLQRRLLYAYIASYFLFLPLRSLARRAILFSSALAPTEVILESFCGPRCGITQREDIRYRFPLLLKESIFLTHGFADSEIFYASRLQLFEMFDHFDASRLEDRLEGCLNPFSLLQYSLFQESAVDKCQTLASHPFTPLLLGVATKNEVLNDIQNSNVFFISLLLVPARQSTPFCNQFSAEDRMTSTRALDSTRTESFRPPPLNLPPPCPTSFKISCRQLRTLRTTHFQAWPLPSR